MAQRLRPALIAFALLAGGMAGTALRAQQPTFRAESAAVNLDVSVTRGGRPVRNLTAADFLLTDAGDTQRVQGASLETLPLSVFLVLDTSGSVAGQKLDRLIDAGRALARSLRPTDRVSLITFSTRVAVRVPLTADGNAVSVALDSLRTEGATALRDAVFATLQLVPTDRTRPVVIVFSDGRDTASWLPASALLDAVRRAGVVIHAVDLVDATDPYSPFLSELVTASGGRRWAATSASRLTGLFTEALNEMRSRYLLTYVPTNTERAGWHPLTIQLTRGRADITYRPGYLVPAR